MPVEYCNRVGKKYFLREGKTKTGKPRYFFSSKQDGKGTVTKSIPDGYEIYEHPENAQVFLRKKLARLITELEEQRVIHTLKSLNKTKRYLVDCKNKYLTIYESSTDNKIIVKPFGKSLSSLILKQFNISENKNKKCDLMNIYDTHYTAVLRFILEDEVKRKFTAERFCFRGAIDDWIYLSGPSNFRILIEEYLDKLCKDALYDLY